MAGDQPLDAAALRRLVDEKANPELHFERTHGRRPRATDRTDQYAMRWHEGEVRRLLADWLKEHADAILAALEEREGLVSDLLRLGLHFDVNEADELVVTMVDSEVRGEEIPAIRDLLASVAVTALRAARGAEEVERG